MAIDHDEFTQWMQLIRDDLKGLNARLDVMNGRTRANEAAIAVLQDRSDGRRGALWGGSVGGLLIAVAEFSRWYLAK